jgi:hypothetical protein
MPLRRLNTTRSIGCRGHLQRQDANCVGASDAEAADGRDVSSEKLMRVAFASLPLATSICAARLADRCGSP